ncbi:hypothetical protein [Thalassotalea agarivorans]|uniref:Uncharacterized protein n=1 Tax=Thalassotalea agarivorans TaxID=349064 RepID=A0A1I0I498_THASX|nr:hypothetical protein [Thalassotalea agarivorans]SET90637.1 hypothetical protein SAMN05660429_03027 [Thalassotalea agarivorans]
MQQLFMVALSLRKEGRDLLGRVADVNGLTNTAKAWTRNSSEREQGTRSKQLGTRDEKILALIARRICAALKGQGAWCMVHGAWCMVHGAWCKLFHLKLMANIFYRHPVML